MAKVLLGDVVDRVKDKVDKDATDLEYYVGGEHIDGDEIMVHRKGLIQGSTIGPAFHMRFQRGDVLLMSRNPHLRKAGMVDFDGICSDVSYICRTKDNDVLLQSLLPFILQTPEFWQFAEENKKGGLPFFLNWKDFARFEFELQTIERQRQIADLLWAMERVKIAYRELIARTDDLVKSQFIEMFGDMAENPFGWPIVGFDDAAVIDATMTTDYEKYADYPHIGIDSIEKDTGRLSGYRTVREDNVKSGKYIFGPQHIIYSKIRPALNKVALPDFEGLCSADAYPILPREDVCMKEFLAHVLRSDFFLQYILAFSGRSQMPKVNRKQISGFRFPLPPIERQRAFVEFMQQRDKSKFAGVNRNLSRCSGTQSITRWDGKSDNYSSLYRMTVQLATV